jgi:F-type H+-transporting ATPase subunit gamma
MGNTRELKKRIKAIKSIRRITKTMQMIATSKFARSQQRATQSKPYTEGIFDLVTELAEKAGNISHSLIDGPADGLKPGAKPLVLVLTSDRGLCGPYNGSILRAAMKHLRGLNDFTLEVVGRKGQSVLKFNKFAIDATHNQFGDKPSFEEVEKLARQYMDRFAAGEISSVHVIYMRFITTSRQRPTVLQLLPLKPPAPEQIAGQTEVAAGTGATVEYDFTPEPAELLSSLLPETVKATLFQAFLDAVVSENVARMIAMKAATDNAGEMGRLISRKYNRARQAQITTELT